MGRVPVSAPMERIAIDILGPLPETDQGNRFIVIIGDYFTKWIEAYATRDHKATTIAKVLVEQFILRYGLPGTIHTDQGRDFESHLIKELCSLLDINKTRTTPWHPQSDGLIERFNRTLETMLKQSVEKHQRDWDLHVPYCCSAYRNASHATTGATSNKLMLGRDLPLPSHLYARIPQEEVNSSIPLVDNIVNKFQEAHTLARQQTQLKVKSYTKQYDRTLNTLKIKPGQWVWLFNPKRRIGISPKLTPQWEEYPYKVLELLSDLVVEIQHYKSICEISAIKGLQNDPHFKA